MFRVKQTCLSVVLISCKRERRGWRVIEEEDPHGDFFKANKHFLFLAAHFDYVNVRQFKDKNSDFNSLSFPSLLTDFDFYTLSLSKLDRY